LDVPPAWTLDVPPAYSQTANVIGARP